MDSTNSVRRLAHAITAHQRNATADLINDASRTAYNERVQRARKTRTAIRGSRSGAATAKAEMARRRRLRIQAEREDLDAALESTRKLLVKEVEQYRPHHSSFKLSPYTSMKYSIEPSLDAALRDAPTTRDRQKIERQIARKEVCLC